jgi:transcriptional regulator with XRE-family HTH domain
MANPKTAARTSFGEAVTDLWLRNGQMMIKEIAKRSGYSATTVSDILHGKRFPKIEVAEDVVKAFGGDFGQLSGLWHELNKSRHNAGATAPPGVEDVTLAASWFATNSEFYAACRQSVEAATEDIRVTYIRQCPPNEVTSSEATAYFAAMLDWAAEPLARSVTRVFGVPGKPSTARTNLLNFLQQHMREKNQRNLKNYTPLVFEYTADADGLNMALIDNDVAFLAISAGKYPQKLSGIRIDSSRYTQALITYFDQLSAGCMKLGDYLIGLGMEVPPE